MLPMCGYFKLIFVAQTLQGGSHQVEVHQVQEFITEGNENAIQLFRI